MAAFYAWLLILFYRIASRSRRSGVFRFRPLQRDQSEIEKIVYRMAEILFAAEITFCGLHRSMSQQELNLLQFTAAIMAQLRAGSPQIMRRNVLQSGSLATSSDHVPDNILRDAVTPHLAQSGDRSKDFAIADPSGACPLVQGSFDPRRNGHRANVATFADQINHRPMALTHLDVVELQANEFRSAKTTTEEHGQHGVIALGTHTITTSTLEYFRTLLGAQPVAGAESELLNALHSAYPGSQLWTQQASVGGFMSQATNGGKLLVDGIGGQMSGFQIQAIAHDDDAVEGQPRLGTVPGDKLVDGILVDPARCWRSEAIENCRFAMIEVRQAEYPATIDRLTSRFAHDDGLPCRSI